MPIDFDFDPDSRYRRRRRPGNPVLNGIFIVGFLIYLVWERANPFKGSGPVFPNVQAQWNAFFSEWTTRIMNLTMTERLLVGGVVGVVMLAFIALLGLLYWQAQARETERGIE